jgi:nitrite reductase/ring-hydroxylating ferredoxin subunit
VREDQPVSEFVKAINLSELPPGECREVLVAGKPVALFHAEGAVYALSNTCVHRGGPLGQGMLTGTTVMCPWHAWTYDVTSGQSTVNPELKVPCYEVRVEDGEVLVKLA